MNTESRFLLAIVLMIAVIIGTNVLFPPALPEDVPGGGVPDTSAVPAAPEPGVGTTPAAEGPPEVPPEVRLPGSADGSGTGSVAGEAPPEAGIPEASVVVEGPLYRYTFSSHGARLVAAELLAFRSLEREGPVQLIPPGTPGALGSRLVVGSDTLDLRSVPFRVEPAEGIVLSEGGGPRSLRFIYEHPSQPFRFDLAYTFDPGGYLVQGEASVTGVDRPLLLTDLGSGIAYNEADSVSEATAMAYVYNHLQEGIESEPLRDVEDAELIEGPLRWAAFKSKFFVLAILAGAAEGDEDFLGGLLVSPLTALESADVAASQPVGNDGVYDFRLFMGPQDYARLSALGNELEEVNPYGWRFFRPVIRPFVAIIMAVLVFLHNTLSLGYGWVLVLFGVLMRVVLWPLNQKAMRAQMRNMAVQPLLKEIQTKHKENPERMQKEMLRLHKEYGFNPLAGCLPMLLPWPVLIALFFVFQNTIELRGVEFLWLPDLSAPDPFYVLPVFLGVSMLVLQWISLRSMEEANPQMKMMMWIMPPFFAFLFANFASGLNLYYATANIATIPQQYWIARERKKVQARGPVKLDKG